ncbi:unnamed protein product (mitochondrion) [Plasmodiophora brassicae]|uniref:CCHC-type domain-containing protein n=1 Tax=Plasmodiophora brassicae TaxID=37360 RepID=A0A0G4IJL3_PLABS|nr:hypothetical protein PBRA_004125 [Plasmodiophora brassicae]SPQ96189.1 unnamed protein product [Plasmodiophora brassicae]
MSASNDCLALISYEGASGTLQAQIERLLASSAASSSAAAAAGASCTHSRRVEYRTRYCIDRCGNDQRISPHVRYEIVNKVALPVRPTSKTACFNCGEEGHPVASCPHPRDNDVIRENSRLLKGDQGAGQGQSQYHQSSNQRYYHERPEPSREDRPAGKYARYDRSMETTSGRHRDYDRGRDSYASESSRSQYYSRSSYR